MIMLIFQKIFGMIRQILYKFQVSSTPATRLDVINLQEQLDMRLQQRQARETGICPVRRELYTQCFGKCKEF